MRVKLVARRLQVVALLASVLGGCSDKGVTSPGEPVASLAIADAPAGPVIAGSMFTLRPIAKDASGNELFGRRVSWSSSDTSVAKVSAAGTVTDIAPGSVTITASCERVEQSVSLDFRVGGVLDASGGTLSAFGGSIALSLLPKVLAGSTNILFRPATVAAAGNLVPGTAFEIAPDLGTLAGTLGRVGVHYPLARGFDAKSLKVARLRDGVWRPIAATVADTMTRMLWAPVSELGTYGILTAPVDHVTIGNVPSSGKVYIGGSSQLVAQPFDSAGNRLTDRPAVWATSDSTIATVASTGYVRGVRGGSVTITLTVEGKSATATLAVTPVPVASVTVVPATLAIYAGQTATLVATPRDSIGGALSGRVVTWSSADPGVASVDANGVVHGLAAGSARIGATAEGVTGGASVQVLPTPVVDWTRASEWTTYQGNAAHSGYVDATIDPGQFHPLWTVSIGAAPNPVTAGDGRVFVSTNSYFGTQLLEALDALTGAVQWTKDFGPIHGVHPPAYGSGTVWVTTSGHADSFLWGFDAATGAVRVKSAYGNQWSRYYAPVVTGDAVYMAGGYYGGMYAFASGDGAQRWFFQTNQYDQWTPALKDGVAYAYTGSYSPKLSAVDASTGSQTFEIPDPDFSWNGWSMDGALALGTQNDALAAHDTRLLSFDLAARAIRWQRAGFGGQVTVAANVLYVAGNGDLRALAEVDGSPLWSWMPPEGRVTGPIVATDNVLFVTTSANTYAIDIASHRQVWSYPAAGALALSSQGILFISRPDGKLTAIALR
ncbi:MAG TPA: Ig-like domain-containing protein [Gemmatimonadaceae bacterium]